MRKLLFWTALVFLVAGCGVSTAERNNAGNSLTRREDYGGALMAYQSAQVENPDAPQAYYNAASALIGLGELDRAIAALEQALKTANDDLTAKAYYNLGNVYFQMGQYEQAFGAYQQTLILRPDDVDARYNLELCLREQMRMQIEPENQETDPTATPTNRPGAFDGPTPTPPPPQQGEPDLTQEPIDGPESENGENSQTPAPQPQGSMTAEQAQRLLDSIQQDQQTLREFLQQAAGTGETSERDW